MKMKQTECCEMLAYKIQTPGNYGEESIQHSEHGETLKSRIISTSILQTAAAHRACERKSCRSWDGTWNEQYCEPHNK